MFDTINKKLIGIVGLLLLCVCMVGIVALQGVNKQELLLKDTEKNIILVTKKIDTLGLMLDDSAVNSVKLTDVATKIGGEFKSIQNLIKKVNKDLALSYEQNIISLSKTCLHLLDLKINSSKFLVDASVKSDNVRKNASGFYKVSMEGFGVDIDESIVIEPDTNPYDAHYVVDDFITSLLSSVNANFYVVVDLLGDFEGQGIYSNQRDFFEVNFRDTDLYLNALNENNMGKGIEKIGDDLTLTSTSFLKNDNDQILGLLFAGYRLDINLLQSLSKNLNASLALFVADKDGAISNAKYSTLTDDSGTILSNLSLPNKVFEQFSIKLDKLIKKDGGKEQINIYSNRFDFIDVQIQELGGLQYNIAYQGLLTDSGKLVGVLAVAQNITTKLTTRKEVIAQTDKAIQMVDIFKIERENISKINDLARMKAGKIIMETKNAETKVDKSLHIVQSVATRTKNTTFIILILSCIIAPFISYFVSKNILKTLGGEPREMADIVSKIADGNLNMEFKTKKDGATGLYSSLITMVMNLRSMIQLISENSTSVHDASLHLSTSSTQMGNDAGEIQGSMGVIFETAQNMTDNANIMANQSDDMSNNINSVAKSIEQLSNSIQIVVQNCADASTKAQQSTDASLDSSKKMEKFSESVRDISQVVDLITDISEQIKLLALNATIESARAGEAGKGFAVVASEVKELAKQTADATLQISTKMEIVQSQSDDILATMNKTTQLNQALDKITDSVVTTVKEQSVTTNEIVQIMSTSATSVTESTESLNEFSKNIKDKILINVQDTLKRIEKLSKNIYGESLNVTVKDDGSLQGASEILADLSDNLETQVSKFKL